MRYLIFCFLVFACSVTFGQSSSAGDIQALEKLNADWIGAYPSKDTTTLSRIFADDLVLVSPNGTHMSKRQIIANVSSPGQQVLSSKVDKVEVRLLGNVGLVVAQASFVTRDDGKEVAGRTNYLDVYEKREGKWVAIAAHVTYIGQ